MKSPRCPRCMTGVLLPEAAVIGRQPGIATVSADVYWVCVNCGWERDERTMAKVQREARREAS